MREIIPSSYRGIMRRALKFFDKLEIKHRANSETLNSEELVSKLNSIIDSLWSESGNTGYIRVDLRSKRAYSLAAQAFLCHAYVHLSGITGQDKFIERAIKLGNYLICHQEENGLFLFHNLPRKPQDEGPATFFSIIALTDLFELIQNGNYLSLAVKAGIAARELLFDEALGYIHTMGQDFWVPNVSAMAAEAYWHLFQLTNEDKYRVWAQDGLAHTLHHITPGGLFPYSEHRKNVYIAGYQAYILWALLGLIKTDLAEDIDEEKIDKGLEYLGSLVREDGSLIEPEMPEVYAYSPSIAASAATWTRLGNEQLFRRNIGFLSKFLYKGKMYTHMDRQGRIFMGNRKRSWKSYVARDLEVIANALNDIQSIER